jgi:hypothetical protein
MYVAVHTRRKGKVACDQRPENVGVPTMRVIRDSRPVTREKQAKPKVKDWEKAEFPIRECPRAEIYWISN